MEPSAAGLRAWRTFLEAHSRVVRQLELEMRRDQDLPLTWYDALLQLHERGGSLRMHELAAALLLSRSATTRFADRLERAGLVERRAAEEDRRGMILTLTDLGRMRLRNAAPGHLDGIERHFCRHLSEEEADQLRGLLAAMADGSVDAAQAEPE